MTVLEDYTLDTLPQFAGREIGVSSWHLVDQARIDAFADVTEDHQWIHVDEARARAESPYGTTIAHGLLTLALLPVMRAEAMPAPEGVARVINYGFDRIRFMAPVPSGARIRLRVVMTGAQPKGDGMLVTTRNTVEVEGSGKPVLVADALTLALRS